VTEVSFHFNVPERLQHAQKLIKKALASGKPMWVTGEAQALAMLDHHLWTHSALDFVPHCFFDAPLQVLAKSSIVLGDSSHVRGDIELLLNLGYEIPSGFEKFDKLIELVGLDARDREEGRNRWKHYAKRGYDIRRHDVGETTAQ
jgi:DNA polymerase III subunit chi